MHNTPKITGICTLKKRDPIHVVLCIIRDGSVVDNPFPSRIPSHVGLQSNHFTTIKLPVASIRMVQSPIQFSNMSATHPCTMWFGNKSHGWNPIWSRLRKHSAQLWKQIANFAVVAVCQMCVAFVHVFDGQVVILCTGFLSGLFTLCRNVEWMNESGVFEEYQGTYFTEILKQQFLCWRPFAISIWILRIADNFV